MTWGEAVRKLGSTVCYCGTAKARGHSFCFFCYRSLPKGLQLRLYEEKGYEVTVEKCEQFLAAQKIVPALLEA